MNFREKGGLMLVLPVSIHAPFKHLIFVLFFPKRRGKCLKNAQKRKKKEKKE